MAIFIYGTKAFTSFKGYFGQKEECPYCHKMYKKGFTKISRWAHLDYIPIFPVGSSYIRFCPVCGNGDVIKSKEAKEIIATFIGMIKREITDEEELEKLEDAIAFKNISNMPARVKCALLAWHTMEDILKKLEEGEK